MQRHHQVGRAGRLPAESCRTSCAAPSPTCATAAAARSLVEIPTDMWNEEVPEPLDYVPVDVDALRPRSGRACARPRAMLVAAKRPVIYAGTGRALGRGLAAAAGAGRAAGAPVTTSLGGKSAFPEDHPLSLGSGGLAIPQPVRHFLDKADLIFGIGCSFTETNFGVKMPKGKTIIHATLDPVRPQQGHPRRRSALVGDAELTLRGAARARSRRCTASRATRRTAVRRDRRQVASRGWRSGCRS